MTKVAGYAGHLGDLTDMRKKRDFYRRGKRLNEKVATKQTFKTYLAGFKLNYIYHT